MLCDRQGRLTLNNFYHAGVQLALAIFGKILIEKKSRTKEVSANAKSVLSVLGACIKNGDEVTIICDGEDEEAALHVMVQIVEDGLGE